MNNKLRLKLDKDITKKTKAYNKSKEITPLVKSLSDIVELPKDYNHKKEYTNYLINKYK
ncbi:MAG: hypothetical protein Q8M29_04300 [Bacteroidota bacterium]|nr:hypothetical protein [Bacteroidota bacterium]